LVRVELQCESVVGFVKLVAGVYAAIAIALLSFLMAPEHGRMTVLVGALFATVINLQVGNSVLGSPEAVSLVDEIHIVAVAYVFVAAVMGVLTWRDYDSGREVRARRRDLVSMCVFGASFLVINAILVALAAS
jgi:putative Ca2+/H+ antiporter (TMEM165/GDT1 family)